MAEDPVAVAQKPGAERRRAPRRALAESLAVRCRVTEGPVRFEGLIVDVSEGGLGALIHDSAVPLQVGMQLPRAVIELPGHPLVASIEVRHVSSVTLAGGVVVRRAGCRFVAPDASMRALVRGFAEHR